LDRSSAAAQATNWDIVMGHRVRVAYVTALVALVVPTLLIGAFTETRAGAATDPGTLSGEGGTFLQPVFTKLIDDAAPNLNSLFGGYVATGIDTGISDFVGSAPGAFAADFAVSERPLTTAEAATAKTDGRSFAYVPFAATPVAVGTLVPDSTYTGGTTITSSELCPHIDMTVADLGALYGYDSANPINNWADSRFTCSNSLPLNANGVTLAANDDPSMANSALMTLLDNDSTAKGFFSAGLASAFASNAATTTDITPSEKWPYTGSYVIAGGDDPFIGKLLSINATTNTPSNESAGWVLGATFPVSSVWTGAPLGAPWNIPTAAVQNAQLSYVVPSTAAAQAAEGDATLAKTSDPTTNNLVTFNASTTDAAAYNNYLMEESYIVVPTSGLPANKDTALASLIRFILGPKGQTDIKSFGAAPATSAMDTAGLAVAAQLDAQAAVGTTTSTTVSSTSTSTTSVSAASPSSGSGASTGTGGGSSGPSGSGTTGSGTGTGSSLAFTGAAGIGQMMAIGASFVVVGTLVRRRLRGRTIRS
jgi:hypothetical protein